MLTPEQILALGVVRVDAGPRTITVTFSKETTGAEAQLRLFGGDLRACNTCRDLGRSTVMPEAALQEHDFTEHRELWMRGRRLAEEEAVRLRHARLEQRALPPGPVR